MWPISMQGIVINGLANWRMMNLFYLLLIIQVLLFYYTWQIKAASWTLIEVKYISNNFPFMNSNYDMSICP